MKRERIEVSAETLDQIVGYVSDSFRGAFANPSDVLNTAKMELLKPLTTGPWTFCVRGKNHPLMRVRFRTRRFVVEPTGIKGWRLAVVNMDNIIGFRVQTKREGRRWSDVIDPDKLVTMGDRFCGIRHGRTQSLGTHEVFYDDMPDPQSSGYISIRLSVGVRTGKSLMDVASSTLQRWLINSMKVDKNTKGMNGLTNLLSRLLEEERPGRGGVKILRGPGILQAYAREDGAHSCMSGRRNTSKIEFYSLNRDQCMLAIVYPTRKCEGKPIARLIVWKQMEDGKEVWFPDRVYPPHTKQIAKARVALNEYANKMKVEIRWFREEGWQDPDDEDWDDGVADDQHEANRADYRGRRGGDGANDKHSPVMLLKLPKSMIMPYMDTMIWAQVLSDGTALFARTPDRLMDTNGMLACPIVLKEGVSVLCNPIQMNNTDGGRWMPVWYVCTCGGKYNSNPPQRFGNTSKKGYWSVSVCEKCYDTLYAQPWTWKEGIAFGTMKEQVRLKGDLTWSSNLKAWVYEAGNNAKKYLIYDKDASDWYLHDDPRWAKKKDSTSPPVSKDTEIKPPFESNSDDTSTDSEEGRRQTRMPFVDPMNPIGAWHYDVGGAMLAPNRTQLPFDPEQRRSQIRPQAIEPPQAPDDVVTIRQENGQGITYVVSALRSSVWRWMNACRNTEIQLGRVRVQWNMGEMSDRTYDEAMNRLHCPTYSDFGFSGTEYRYAINQGWIREYHRERAEHDN